MNTEKIPRFHQLKRRIQRHAMGAVAAAKAGRQRAQQALNHSQAQLAALQDKLQHQTSVASLQLHVQQGRAYRERLAKQHEQVRLQQAQEQASYRQAVRAQCEARALQKLQARSQQRRQRQAQQAQAQLEADLVAAQRRRR